MSDHDTITAFIIDTQIKIFDDASHDLQLSQAKIAERAKLSICTVHAWAQGRNTLTLWGVKKLLRVKELAPLLSRLFEPEDYALVAVMAGIDHDELATAAHDYLAAKQAAHHPESEAGRDIGPGEHSALTGKAVGLRVAA